MKDTILPCSYTCKGIPHPRFMGEGTEGMWTHAHIAPFFFPRLTIPPQFSLASVQFSRAGMSNSLDYRPVFSNLRVTLGLSTTAQSLVNSSIIWIKSIHVTGSFSLVAQSYLTLCNSKDYSTPGFPVHHQLLEPAQTHVHHVSDAIQPFHLISSCPLLLLPQHQGLFQWVSSSHQMPKVLEFQLQHQSFQWIFMTDFL